MKQLNPERSDMHYLYRNLDYGAMRPSKRQRVRVVWGWVRRKLKLEGVNG